MASDKRQVLKLNAGQEDFEKIQSGEMIELYRKASANWVNRLIEGVDTDHNLIFKVYDEVHIRKGDGKEPVLKLECLGVFMEPWAETDLNKEDFEWEDFYFVIELGEKL